MQCLNFFKNKQDHTKDIDRLQSLSLKIEQKLSSFNFPDVKIDKLTKDELQDIGKIVKLTNFMLCKYDDKKETRAILEYFASIITESIESMGCIDDEISELILSAEDSIHKIKNLHSKISEKSDLKKSYLELTDTDPEFGSINLTKFTTAINTSKYQQNSQEDCVQVI